MQCIYANDYSGEGNTNYPDNILKGNELLKFQTYGHTKKCVFYVREFIEPYPLTIQRITSNFLKALRIIIIPFQHR